MNESQLNIFLTGQTILSVNKYNAALHIILENGAMLTVNVSPYGNLRADILGPDPPDPELLREMWDSEVDNS